MVSDVYVLGGGQTLMDRRRALAVLGAALAALAAPVRALGAACRQLVAADNGPFYPKEAIGLTNDLLIERPGHPGPPGIRVHFLGEVLDDACRPVEGATVEVWQCDAGGQYRHPNAPKIKQLERDFRYFAKAMTADDGRFVFRTIRPAPYVAFGTPRAPHIHVKIKAPGHAVATTEVYFHGSDDEARQHADPVFQSRGPRRDEMLVTLVPAVRMRERLAAAEPGALAFEQQFTLKPLA